MTSPTSRQPTSLKLFLFLLSLELFVFNSNIVFPSLSCLAAEDNGFGENVNWIDYEAALADTLKPTLVILHKSWCPACKSLKPKILESSEFEKLSGKFSLVNVKEDNPVHDLAEFNIDGTYIPRVFFLDPDGKVLSDIANANGNPNYKYYHYQVSTILDAMKKVLHEFPVKDEL